MDCGIDGLTRNCRRHIAGVVVDFRLSEDLSWSIASTTTTTGATLRFEAKSQEIPSREQIVGGFGECHRFLTNESMVIEIACVTRDKRAMMLLLLLLLLLCALWFVERTKIRRKIRK